MLSKEQIAMNKQAYIDLLKSIKREGADIEGLIKKLETSDFFTAPASTQYHSSYEGGLCDHSLNVYEKLVMLVNNCYPDNNPYSNETLIIVALLHDLSKMNFYEVAERNVKDANGNWTKVPFIKTREAKDRFIYASHGVNSEYMTGRFIPLSIEESAAIIHHMGGKEAGAPVFDGAITEVFNRFSLSILLHTADMLATFIDERLI